MASNLQLQEFSILKTQAEFLRGDLGQIVEGTTDDTALIRNATGEGFSNLEAAFNNLKRILRDQGDVGLANDIESTVASLQVAVLAARRQINMATLGVDTGPVGKDILQRERPSSITGFVRKAFGRGAAEALTEVTKSLGKAAVPVAVGFVALAVVIVGAKFR